jgi:CYTH domain-containing protein
MEIERKFLVNKLPANLKEYTCKSIEQAYLSTEPVVRIRKSNEKYTLTYKSKGFLSREEYNMPLTKESYFHLKEKADGNIISKKRYLIPLGPNLTIELDIFESPFDCLILAEVEFDTEEHALNFEPPEWFGEDVTYSQKYQNSYLSSQTI